MEVYLGRQPILDRSQTVVGYELLFRSSENNFCDSSDPIMATSQVIVNAVLGVGLDRLLGGKPAFINFDRTLLLGDWTTLLPPNKSVIEILETVPPDEEVLAACHKLRQEGYALALDDCLDDTRTAAFAPLVDILKVNVQNTSREGQKGIVRRYQKLNIRLVAKNVETEQEFGTARQLGYHYFQGYFFAKPSILQVAHAPASRMCALRLVRQIQRDELDFEAIEELIRSDVMFSRSLLKYVNSPAFRWARRVESIRHGMTLLGLGEIRKWAWMASLSILGEDRPAVLMAQVLMRGRFCEAIACAAMLSPAESDPFLLGMLSLLDAILERPLRGIHNDLNIGQNIRNVLLGTGDEADTLSLALRIVKSYEVGDWQDVAAAARVIGLSASQLNKCYLESLSWVDKVFSPDEGGSQTARLSVPIDFHRDPETHPATQH